MELQDEKLQEENRFISKPNYIREISQIMDLRDFQVQAVLEMIENGDSVPFIARYRKEKTQNLDEDQIRDIVAGQKKIQNLYEAKKTALDALFEMGKLTDDILQNILKASTLKEVEDIYKPFKSKRKTKAMIALEKGFGEVAENIKQNILSIPENFLKEYSKEEIIEGALEIIGAEISIDADIRSVLIENYTKYGFLETTKKSQKMLEKLSEKDQEQIPKFELYFEGSFKISNIKPYQILAINRGEKLGILGVKITKDEIIFEKSRNTYLAKLGLKGDIIPELESAFKIGYDALFSSGENEIRSNLKEKGEDESIKTFQKNLEVLLLSKPEYGKNILAIDPGYRAGCKLAVLDTLGNPLFLDKIFLHKSENAKLTLQDIFQKYTIDVVVIGNGTGTDETQALIGEVFSKDIFVVNESGASVYSACKIAAEEFPDVDVLDRGTISIGRRYIDPLSELVKIPVGSIGVGMYQHDIPEKKLSEKLGYVVEDSVNQVGINVNTASVYLLAHISGIDKRQAKKIYNNRPYHSRQELEKVLGENAYRQAIGFLRVPESSEILDNTDIHPEQYMFAKYIIENNISKLDQKAKELYEDANQDTLEFVKISYKQAGQEKRTTSTHMKAKKTLTIDEVKVGDILYGVVRNVVAFGAFVDIGLKNDGLVHVSQIAHQFVKDPNDFLQIGDKVKVKIIELDKERGKINLSMKDV